MSVYTKSEKCIQASVHFNCLIVLNEFTIRNSNDTVISQLFLMSQFSNDSIISEGSQYFEEIKNILSGAICN